MKTKRDTLAMVPVAVPGAGKRNGNALTPLDRYCARFAADVALEAFLAAEAIYWNRWAEMFEWAKPKLGEFYGQATPAELSVRWKRLHAQAEACRNRARLAEVGGVW